MSNFLNCHSRKLHLTVVCGSDSHMLNFVIANICNSTGVLPSWSLLYIETKLGMGNG